MLERNVEGARLEEPLHQIVEVLGHEVVEVRLDHRDAVAREPVPAPQDRAQHVRQRPGPIVARAVADPLDRHRGQHAELVDDVRRIAAPVGVTVSQATCAGTVGMPASSSSVAGAGSGRRPWADSTVPWPSATGEQVTRSIASRSRAIAAAVDVDDRVDGADLVEVDVVEVDAVDPGLGAAERLEDRQRARLHRRREPRALDQAADLGVAAAVGVAVRWVCAHGRGPDRHARGECG